MSPINLVPEKVETITMACCALHNFLRSRTDVYIPPGSVDKEDSDSCYSTRGVASRSSINSGLVPLARQSSNTYSKMAKDLREQSCDYFNTKEGEVSWQEKMI